MSHELSVKMQGWLEHVRAASKQGMRLSAYAAQAGVSASGLYQAKSQLMKVGAWPRSSSRAARVQSKPAGKDSRFVAVKVSAPVGCRLSHVSGWSIECGTLPPAAWLQSLLQGANHAS